MKEILIEMLQRLFILAEEHIPLNVSKVLAVGNIAGFLYAVLCLDTDYWARAIPVIFLCGMLAAFFMTLTVLIEEE